MTQEPYDQQFFLFSGADPGAVRGTNYEEVYPLGHTVTVARSQQVAMERAAERDLKNVRFMDRDAGLLGEIFAPGEVSRLYINFCDPWPKSRDAKLRLTAPGFLRVYADLLAPGGEIHFKTDNAALFEWSLAGFAEEGWETRNVTRDLHAGGPSGVMTDNSGDGSNYRDNMGCRWMIRIPEATSITFTFEEGGSRSPAAQRLAHRRARLCRKRGSRIGGI